MPTLLPSRCPFCESHDIRRLPSDDDIVGYQCHDCGRVFYTPPVQVLKAAPPKK